VLAQWVAWRVRLPSILLLLIAGIVAGPVTGVIEPDKQFGKLLLPLVSLSVAVILYEGGLNLKLRELRQIGRVLFLLITVGAAITWAIGSVAAHYLLGLPWQVAILLGAILVVTGPTVIGPILRHLRLGGRLGALLKWEGIVIDPLGATLAVLMFSIVQASGIQAGLGRAAIDLGLTLLVGIVFGALAAVVVLLALARFWVPDFLHNPFSLMVMFAAFTAANLVQDESGLLVVTCMGLVLANQKWVSIRHVVEFKETLTVLLISCLFIVLAARLQVADLRGLGWESGAFVAVMMLVARPVSVLTSAAGSSLSWKERLFLAWMAPRGIVAAAVTSVFALSLAEAGHPQAVQMVPITFLLVFVTVLVYGVSAAPLARWLGLIQINPQGVLLVGAEDWIRALAEALKSENCGVFLIDTDWDNISACRMAGLPCYYGSALAERTREEVELSGLGRMLALTENNAVNSLACLRYAEDFGRQEVYQLPFATAPDGRHAAVAPEHRGRLLFGKEMTADRIAPWIARPPGIKKTRLSKEFDFQAFQAQHGKAALVLFVLKPDGTLHIGTAAANLEPKAGDLVMWILPPPGDAPLPAASQPV
jgi:NhaP-type Na+/H+ or K+/H+ antiporter